MIKTDINTIRTDPLHARSGQTDLVEKVECLEHKSSQKFV